jgi:pimeloyl-ACP methyl ester carboxylesterase
MKNFFLPLMIVLPALLSCQKEIITIGTNVNETFYVQNKGASMRVLVRGNNSGKVFIVFVHGGPGAGAFLYDTDYLAANIGDKYAMVYWDERNAGASQGTTNGNYLTLGQMTDDLKKVLEVLKARYGEDSDLFLLGHSFGGLLTSSFMTSEDNQSMIKGWIYADCSHNYPLNDTLTREMLLSNGQQQIALNNHKEEWEEIVSYCNIHTGNFSYEESHQLETYAGDAETYFEEVPRFDLWSHIREYAIRNKWPLTSILMNYRYSSEASFNKDLAKTTFSSSLFRVTVPVLILYGKYDFICPRELGDDFFKRIGSDDKKIVISPVSGHNIMFQDEVLFCSEVNKFVGLHK